MADVIFEYSYATNNAAPPGNQQLRLNQTTSATVTAVYADDQDLSGATVRDQLLATTAGTQLTVVSGSNEAVFASYSTTAVTGQSGYVEFTVAFLEGSGTIQTGTCTLEFTAAATGGSYEVISFVNFRPPPRYDNLPFTHLVIEESSDAQDPWTQIDTFPLVPVDADPTQPQLRNFTTEKGTALGYWYRVTFRDATGDESPPTTPIQNTGTAAPSPTYGSTGELARILKIRAPTADQLTAMQRVLDAASGEVNSEIDRSTDLTGWQIQLATEVTLERAVEHWQQEEVPYGIWENAVGPVVVGRDTWDRHALKLAPLKQNWGFA